MLPPQHPLVYYFASRRATQLTTLLVTMSTTYLTLYCAEYKSGEQRYSGVLPVNRQYVNEAQIPRGVSLLTDLHICTVRSS